MREIGVDISGFATTAERLGQEGYRRSMRLLTVNWRRDYRRGRPIKPSTPAAINALHQFGMSP